MARQARDSEARPDRGGTWRAGRVLVALVVVAAVGWAVAGLRKVEPGDRVVAWSRVAGMAPRELEPGIRWMPAGLADVERHVRGPVTIAVASADVGPPLVTREGARLDLAGAVVVDVRDPAAAHARLGADWRRGVVSSLGDAARARLASGEPIDPSPLGMARVGRELTPALAAALSPAGIDLVAVRLGLAASAPAASVERHVTGVKVLLVGIDAFDWNVVDPLMEAGRMPRLAQLADRGVRARLRTINPVLSPVIWTSIATGRLPEEHGILDFLTVDASTSRLVPVTSTERKVRAIWNVLGEAGLSANVAGWWATWPAEPIEGVVVSERLAYQLFSRDEHRATDAVGMVFPPEAHAEIARLVVEPSSIGDDDLRRFVPAGRSSAAARRHADLLDQLATAIAAERTYLAVGRHLLASRPAALTTVYFESPDTVAHLFMRYRPPRSPDVAPDEVAAFGEAVDRYWAAQDDVIGSLVDAAGPDTTVVLCSDHGFKTGEARPLAASTVDQATAALWHRTFGVLVLAGPGVLAGGRIEEASILDVTPTLLTLLGLPVSDEMDGRVLEEALDPGGFLSRFPVRRIPTYEGPTPFARPAAPADRGDAALVEKLVALGYVGAPPAAGARPEETRAAESGALANRHVSLGVAAMEAGRLDDAERELREALLLGPTTARARVPLARVLAETGRMDEATKLLQEAGAADAADPEPIYWLARLAFGRNDVDTAEKRLADALARNALHAPSLVLSGRAHLARGDAAGARAAFERASRLDPDLPGPWSGLGQAAVAAGDAAAAERHFRRALEADPRYSPALVQLAEVLAASGRAQDAERELRRATDVDATNPGAWVARARFLAQAGQRDGAIAVLEDGAARLPTSAPIQFDLGVLLIESGRVDAGLAALRRARDLAPGNAAVASALARAEQEAAARGR